MRFNFFCTSIFLLNVLPSIAQSDIDKVLKGSEIIVNGLSFLKNNKSTSNSKVVESVCIKNRLSEKITLYLIGKDDDGKETKKEMIVQKDGKECVFEIPKGIYTYEIVLANKEVFKKGEYKFNEEITIIVKQD